MQKLKNAGLRARIMVASEVVYVCDCHGFNNLLVDPRVVRQADDNRLHGRVGEGVTPG
jgi:hypothetical protein